MLFSHTKYILFWHFSQTEIKITFFLKKLIWLKLAKKKFKLYLFFYHDSATHIVFSKGNEYLVQNDTWMY